MRQAVWPGKRTLVEQWLAGDRRATGAGSWPAVGRQTLVERYYQPAVPAPRVSSAEPGVSLPPVAPSVLDGFRSRGLHEVLAALASMRGQYGLMDAARSAAARATQPARSSLTVRPAPPDPAGQAMWRAAERRAATLYRRAVESGEISAADPAVEAALARAGGGRSLPADVRREMELEFAVSLERVRIHTDAIAADAARAVRAEAFTVGEDIFFADGAYAPETPAGRRLLAHELTHVLQAYQGRAETAGSGIKVSSPGEALEREADAVADRVGAVRVTRAARVAPEVTPKPARPPSTPAGPVRVMRKPPIPGRTFAEPSSPVGKLGRVQAPKGVLLRVQPAPGAASPFAPLPFNGLVYVESRTTQARANERWCYVIATEVGAAGFCEERYLAIDPPEPTAKLRRTQKLERLAVIAEEAYGLAKDANNSRLYVQALYLANRGRAGVRLDRVDLSFWDRTLRGEDEEETLKVYKGATVLEGHSIWIPSKAFIEQLKAAGAVTGGSTYAMDAWHRTKDFADGVLDGAKYAAGFIVGILEGAANAVVDLFKGAAGMVEAVLEVIWHLVTGNLGRIRDMLMSWVAKLRLAWDRRGQIVDEFVKRWTADSMWDRGLFQGEVLGWIMMTVLLLLVTLGEAAPAAIGGIALRWPQLTKLLQTVDALGDVTTYLGAAAKTTHLPREAAAVVSGKLGRSPHSRAGARGSGQADDLAIRTSRAAAIERGYADVTGRQAKLLEQLPAAGSRCVVPKRSVKVNDLAALTAKTGDEFTVFTKGNQRMIVRGTPNGVDMSVAELTAMKKAGWKWSGHTHPGTSDLVLDASGHPGDRMVLEIFEQDRSLILNSRGARNVFDQNDNIRIPDGGPKR
ncbi:MAG TPA: DUF4157 domain-containing protein [Kofleriaceae bacterium]|nr:DUF4157 domain-containing protein [Kofleriaceae bacterium]